MTLSTRFIPAYAGNSTRNLNVSPGRTVHPRLRGELFCNDREIKICNRFIPAYAGNSRTVSVIFIFPPVHPRLRGELRTLISTDFAFNGSSPLTRGTHLARLYRIHRNRFIPAYAGNSFLEKMLTSSIAVHPRLRGELQLHRPRWNRDRGSSPLTRGTRSKNGVPLGRLPVHPRLRGEL